MDTTVLGQYGIVAFCVVFAFTIIKQMIENTSKQTDAYLSKYDSLVEQISKLAQAVSNNTTVLSDQTKMLASLMEKVGETNGQKENE